MTPAMSSEVAIGRLIKGSEMFIKLVKTGYRQGRDPARPEQTGRGRSLPAGKTTAGTPLWLCIWRFIRSSCFLAALMIWAGTIGFANSLR